MWNKTQKQALYTRNPTVIWRARKAAPDLSVVVSDCSPIGLWEWEIGDATMPAHRVPCQNKLLFIINWDSFDSVILPILVMY